ncbi:ABC transporter ATP-binding protein [Bradyrhizobium barranii]|jgi:branched-chain amino acid transport system ATP-binding protein|uniref:ABC transporter ATP-binding protein n=1 Tax=Bradyrhizobium barranii TaxID=2992140 RepID=A0ABY3QYB5_9BRAD|nr:MULTISPECIES: ABC transporter ATP-binding protein [Bradyrhizobium]UFW90061.1 ABC transporter ATP-binding protein [Bradyrhizobium japonicum]CUU19677.1 Branchedchain amino acid transport ATPbinding protein LivF TC 3A141 CDS [Bradyrhizobium sp.]
MSLLEIERLTAGYGEAVVLEEMSLSVSEGECLAVLGRNGVGKSTLMLAIMAHAARFAGRLRWDGHDFSTLSTNQRVGLGLGWVPQEREIFPSLTVEENLLVAHRRGGRFDLNGIYEVFPRLKQRRRNMGDKLSGGEQQMLAIGRTLMTSPRLLLLDEPFEGLAPVIVEELEETLMRLRRDSGFAIIIVEQRAEDVLRLSDRAIVLDRGKIVLEGKSAELLADFEQVHRWLSV